MSIQPEELASNLINKLHDISVGLSPVNDLLLQSLKNDADKLLRLDVANAMIVKAGIAFFEHKTRDMLAFHQRAFDIAPQNYVAVMNFASSCHNTGRYQQALELGLMAYDIYGDGDRELLEHIVDYAFSAGSIRTAFTFAEKVKQQFKTEVVNYDVFTDSIEVMDNLSLSDKDVETFFRAAGDVLVANDIYTDGVASWYSQDMEIISEIFVKTDVETAARMNVELSQNLSAKALPVDVLMNFCCLFTVADNT